ncbi:fatty-acid--CoA ligase [Mycolicibacterium aromaticivorans JS19b1 = JCM 16368]|uniref:Fatty-acid--CoA ligase n=1 Tax=Mycolicibacterium aromaticivorans JS19b1 = JCM 16368 TaxID=1440774 RepID=A0A064CQX6_9MYCO|nr:AMP-binding protein [Mycolicibacterium aromaticivorans]KDF01129.1 fatty-acid--CoA ligase [Mycolicibacterium aromaticivorans JS19b1 = JCM 16368]
MRRDSVCGNTTDDLLARYVSPDGTISVPDDLTLTSFLAGHAEAEDHHAAYRFIDYSRDREGSVEELSWQSLEAATNAVAARLRQVTEPGDRVAIMAPHGLHYVIGFFAAIHAGAIAVPLFVPALTGHTERLRAILSDADPRVILTTESAAESLREMLRTMAPVERPRVIAVDAVPVSLGEDLTRPERGADDIAYLQYTSGSTRTPVGVEITHRAACTNVAQMILAGRLDMGVRSVSWLPLYHDMGLVMIMFPMLCGGQITLMDPMAFVRRPYRWIRQLSEEAVHGRTFAAAPNFAFALCAERGLPPTGERPDLSNVVGLLNGSEPVTMGAIEKFAAAFTAYGLPATAVKPSYGMAEATLSVASIAADCAPSAVHLDRNALARGHAVRVEAEAPGGVSLVSCGQPIASQWLVIVDSVAGAELPDGSVGEIWLHGNNIGRGYWRRPDETQRVFANKLQTRLSYSSHADGVADNETWLSTGDLGVYLDGELYVTGRIKDLIIIDGRNHYPVDVEATVSKSTPAIRDGFVAAFAVSPSERVEGSGMAGEHLVVVAERAVGSNRMEPTLIAEAVRAAVARTHHISVSDFRLVPAGAIPRTTSGKLARNACRTAYLAGEFD